jgi:putative oxidoreductase
MATNIVVGLGEVPRPTKALNIALWILQILAAATFLLAGGLKLAGVEPMVAMFDKIGLGQWFRYLTGGLEVTGAILLLIPTTAALGGALLAVTMVGAIATHLFVLGGSAVPAVVLLVMVATVTWYRWPTSITGEIEGTRKYEGGDHGHSFRL